MFKKTLFLLFVFLQCIILNCSHAHDSDFNNSNPTEVIVKLDAITVNKPVKDKIYIEITEYSSINKAKEYRIPTYPKHWLIKDLPKLKNTILWNGIIQDSENKKLIISLVDNDYPPLDSDQPLGSVKLTLTNKNDKINIDWDKAGFKEPINIQKISSSDGSEHVTFKMQSKRSEYTVGFFVKTNP